jgi:hypothetical protein
MLMVAWLTGSGSGYAKGRSSWRSWRKLCRGPRHAPWVTVEELRELVVYFEGQAFLEERTSTKLENGDGSDEPAGTLRIEVRCGPDFAPKTRAALGRATIRSGVGGSSRAAFERLARALRGAEYTPDP